MICFNLFSQRPFFLRNLSHLIKTQIEASRHSESISVCFAENEYLNGRLMHEPAVNIGWNVKI